jgi:5,6-dimethylbenzimidazole synthase
MSAPHSFNEEEKKAVYRVIKERRDVRRFYSHPIPSATLQKILDAAMQAPSVGYMQPWNFILIQDMNVRRKVHASFLKANEEAKKLFPGEKGEKYASLKLEGLLESALNICVTCDRNRFGPVGLGRTCQPEMDLYSTVCAVQNLWLAARCEGIGVGWVSIIKPEELPPILGLPEGVVPIAYLCVGYTEAFAIEPELKTAGWNPQIPTSELVFWDQWGQRSMTEPS